MRFLLPILFFSRLLFGVINPPVTAKLLGSTLTSSYQLVCDSVSGKCLSGITNGGKYYQHLMAANEANDKISFAMTVGNDLTAPSPTTQQKFVVVSANGSAWDDIAVFNNIFVRAENTIPNSQDITVTIW